jgi:L-malate glycosyltransferase
MDRPLRICVLTTSFPLDTEIAVGIHVLEKCRHLVRKGHAVTVIAPHHKGAARRETIDGIEVHRFRYMFPARWQTLCYGAGIPTNFKRSFWARLQLPFLLLAFPWAAFWATRDADVIHANWSLAGFAGIVAGRLRRRPVVMTMYGAEVFVLGRHPFLRFILKRVNYIISISRYTETHTLAVHPVARHTLIPPGTDTKRFIPTEDPTLRERIGIRKDAFLVFALAKFIERKGFIYLIDAMTALVRDHPDANIQLALGGRGPLRASMQALVRERGLDDQIKFLEYIPDAEIPAYFTACDVFVLPAIIDPSGDTEGLGVVLLEANACGTPVIASRVGGITDAVEDGVNGFLVPPGDPAALAERILYLHRHPEVGRACGQRGRALVGERFAWDRITDRIVDVYRELTGGTP